MGLLAQIRRHIVMLLFAWVKALLARRVGSAYCPGVESALTHTAQRSVADAQPQHVTVGRLVAVARIDKLWDRLQSRFNERNFAFDDLRTILLSLGFDERALINRHGLLGGRHDG